MDLIVLCLNPFHSPPASFFSQDRIIAEPEGLVRGSRIELFRTGSRNNAGTGHLFSLKMVFT
jgi:hypothetical protein